MTISEQQESDNEKQCAMEPHQSSDKRGIDDDSKTLLFYFSMKTYVMTLH